MHTESHTHNSEATAYRWAMRWVSLGLLALALAGIFSIILVVARTPQLAGLTQLFSMALVVHVDLSVLVWFLSVSVAAMLAWAPATLHKVPLIKPAAFISAALATLLMALSPLDGAWEVIKSNYIPVLDSPMFFLSLAFLFSAMIVACVPVILQPPPRVSTQQDVKHFFSWSLGWLMALSIIAFLMTASGLPENLPRPYRFELLFWAGGHQLQLLYTQLAVLAWLVLIERTAGTLHKKSLVLLTVSGIITLLVSAASLGAFALYPLDSAEFREFFTHVMRGGGGLGAGIALVVLVLQWIRSSNIRAQRAYHASLLMSWVLFIAGGAIGYAISGQNVTIPAHYHGSIVGVTLALMGLAYSWLPQAGYQSVASSRMAFWQPILYGGGQLLHIGGLAVSGGYGVLRKSTAALSAEAKITMGIMGFGGLLAIIGGLMFVVVMVRVLRAGRKA